MNTKTLNALQILAKIGRILSMIVFIFSIVGSASFVSQSFPKDFRSVK